MGVKFQNISKSLLFWLKVDFINFNVIASVPKRFKIHTAEKHTDSHYLLKPYCWAKESSTQIFSLTILNKQSIFTIYIPFFVNFISEEV